MIKKHKAEHIHKFNCTKKCKKIYCICISFVSFYWAYHNRQWIENCAHFHSNIHPFPLPKNALGRLSIWSKTCPLFCFFFFLFFFFYIFLSTKSVLIEINVSKKNHPPTTCEFTFPLAFYFLRNVFHFFSSFMFDFSFLSVFLEPYQKNNSNCLGDT